MKIAVIGANGKAGSLFTMEAIKRGHEVTSVIRSNNAAVGTKVLQKDLFQLTYDDLKDQDIVIDAFGAWTPETIPQHITATKHLCDLLSGRQIRLLVVGGAGSLFVNPEHTVTLMETPEFPGMFKPLAKVQSDALQLLRTRDDVRWTFLSPAADFRFDGPRTGVYKAGGEELTLSDAGESQISYADYAVAMLDEAENGKHVRARFSVVSR